MDQVSKLHGIYSHKSVDALFLDPTGYQKTLCQCLKSVFDVAVKESVRPFGPLDELITENLDSESIWEEIQTRNRPVIRYIKNQIGKRKAEEERLRAETEKMDEETASESGSDSEQDSGSGSGCDDSEEEEDFTQEEDEESDEDEDEDDGDSSEGDFSDASVSEGDGVEVEDEVVDADGRTSRRYDEMDDDMEAFLDRADELEEKYQNKLEALEKKNKGHRGVLELDDYDSDDEFKDETDDMLAVTDAIYASDADESEEEDEDEDGIHAEDFFGKPVAKSKSKGKGKRNVAFAEVPDAEDSDGDFEGEEDDWGEDDEENETERAKDVPTRQGKQEASLHRQIEELEADLMQPKSWDLTGEVGSSARPENSLLGIVTEVDRSSKPAPIITQQYSATIEELIKKRILEERWDDMLAPSVAAGNVPASGARGGGQGDNDFELSQEKSKEGLGDVSWLLCM